jgi:phage shock protein A
VIDRLREQIQQRLDQLAGEVDRLRRALAALDPRAPSKATPKAAARTAPAAKRARSAVSTTLSKLAQSGEAQKAERGYRIAPAAKAVPAPSGASSEVIA